MKTSKEFDNILDECLERLLVKSETVEQCLQSYPEQAAELEPLLQTAVTAKKALVIQPSSKFRAEARYQFHLALQEVASKRSRPLFDWFPQWATVAVLVLGLMMVGGGTIAAAGYSMPDNPLYPVKLTTEQVQLALTSSDLGKAQLYANQADKRVVEIIYLANKGDAQQIEAITQRLDERLVMLASLVSTTKVSDTPRLMAPSPTPALTEEATGDGGAYVAENNQTELRTTIARYAVDHPAALRVALEKAPEPAKPALRQAITVSIADYERILKALD